MSSTLTIGGVSVTPGPGTPIVVDRLTLSLDRPDELEFTALATDLPGGYAPEQAVTLTDGATTLFSGWIFSRSPGGFGVGAGRIGYRCLGLSYGAALIAITASDGTGTMAFNLPTTDPYYSATEAGLSVGTVIGQVLAQHASQLAAIGVSTDATTTTQLAALTVVGPDPIYISGNSLWTQLQQFIQQWYASRYALYITPAGLVRCYDTFSLTAETITLDSDPAILTSMTEDTSECYTQVVLRGRDDVEAAWATLHDGTLVGEATSGGGWTPTQQSSWTWGEFAYPQNGYDQGQITALTSTVVTVKSDSATTHWALNFWNGIQGTIAVINPIITGLGGFQEVRHITACSALTAGGTATITLDRPLGNSGYTRYQIVGFPVGLSQVWRKYVLSNTYVAEHLVQQFNYGVPFQIGMGSTSLVQTPIAAISYSQAGITQIQQVPCQVVPFDGTTPGYVLMNNPVVQYTSTQAQLNAGGASVVAPTDVLVMLPYSRGALSVTSPSGGGYSGTAHTLFGVSRTLYRDYPAWLDAGLSSNMQALADNILATVSNATQEGSVTYCGKYAAALPGGSWPIALNVAIAGGTTGYEAMAAPVRTVTLEWAQDGGSTWRTHLGFSTRRQQYSGDRLFVHAMWLQGGFGPESGTVGGGGPRFVGESGFAMLPQQEHFDVGLAYREAGAAAGLTGDEENTYQAPKGGGNLTPEERAAVDRDRKQNAERMARRDNADRRARMDVHDERGQEMAGEEATAKGEERENTERLVKTNNRRRARTLEGREERETRLSYERAGADSGPDDTATGGG